MEIRSAQPTDFAQLAKIENQTQFAPWSKETFRRCVEAGYLCWVLVDNEELLGFVMVSIQLVDCHILNLGVSPLYQRQGFGQQLLTFALLAAKQQGATRAYLEVRKSNQNAICLYEKLGFVTIAERKDYYPVVDGREDALIFALDLHLV